MKLRELARFIGIVIVITGLTAVGYLALHRSSETNDLLKKLRKVERFIKKDLRAHRIRNEQIAHTMECLAKIPDGITTDSDIEGCRKEARSYRPPSLFHGADPQVKHPPSSTSRWGLREP